jgi:hypothetical protein
MIKNIIFKILLEVTYNWHEKNVNFVRKCLTERAAMSPEVFKNFHFWYKIRKGYILYFIRIVLAVCSQDVGKTWTYLRNIIHKLHVWREAEDCIFYRKIRTEFWATLRPKYPRIPYYFE